MGIRPPKDTTRGDGPCETEDDEDTGKEHKKSITVRGNTKR